MMVQFTWSSTRFCGGLYGMDVCFSMSWSFKNKSNALEMYSPVLSNWNALILCSDYVSTNALNFSKHFPLDFNTYNHNFLIKLLMKVTKYLVPPIDVVLRGPHTVECTISKGLVACLPPLVWKLSTISQPIPWVGWATRSIILASCKFFHSMLHSRYNVNLMMWKDLNFTEYCYKVGGQYEGVKWHLLKN